MSSLDMYSLTKMDMEEQAETIKLTIFKALVRDGVIDFDVADKWCQTHSVILTKKTIFKTISNLWEKKDSSGGYFYSVVSLE